MNYTIHSGSPIHTGRPYTSTIRLIFLLTTKDSRDRQYYRTSPTESWQRLRTPADHDALNKAINYHLQRHGASNQDT